MRIAQFIINLLAGYNVEDKINALNQQINSIKSQNSNLLSATNRFRSKLSSAEEKIDVLAQNKQALASQVNETEHKLNEVRSLYNEYKEKYETQNTLNRQKQGFILSKTNENRKLSTKLEEVIKKNNELTSIQETIKNENESLKQEIREKEISLINKDNDYTTLSNEHECLKDTYQNQLDELSSANNLINSLQIDKQNLADRISSLLEENKNQDEQLKAKENEIITLNNQLDLLSEQVGSTSDINAELRDLELQNQRLEENLAEKSRALEIAHEQIKQKNENINSLTNALNNARNTNNELNDKISSLEKRIKLLSQDLTNYQNTISTNNILIDKLKEELASNEKTELNDTLKQNVETVSFEEDTTKISSEPNKISVEGGLNYSKIITFDETAACHPTQDEYKPGSTTIKRSIKKHKKSKAEEAIDISNGAIEDFPVITNDSNREVHRSIEYVRDEHNNIIYADDFFERSAEEISQVARKLVEAEIKGTLYWTCGFCRKRVKIAHRLFHGTESLFFIHARKDTDCLWAKPAIKSDDKNNEMIQFVDDEDIQEDITIDDYKPNSRILKEKIITLLSTFESQEMGISNVAMDKVIKSNMPYMKWRRPEISFVYNNRKMVIELQKKRQNLTTIVDKDVFYRLNDIQVIWIFGSDSDTSYDYMRQSNYKNTMFDNHRNVFVFDKEAQEESEKQNILLLKCNWLEPNDEWSIRVKDTGTNGKLIAFTNLIFDDEYCKPYHYDANEPYFQLHPDARDAYLKTRVSREELLKSLEEKWTRDPNYEEAQNQMRIHGQKATPFKSNNLWGFRFNTTTLMQPIFSTEPKDLTNGYYLVNQYGNLGILDIYAQKVIDWDGTFMYDDMEFDESNRRLFIKNNNYWGVADTKGNILINIEYHRISPWSKTIYRVKTNNKWGLCDINNQLISECKYESIEELNNGKAKVTLVNPLNIAQILTGFIDKEGKLLFEQKINQPDGTSIIQQFGRWGIIDKDNKVIIQSLYEEIKPWSDSLYRIRKGNKWGIFDVKTQKYLLDIQYDSIGDLISEVAPITHVGVVSHIDITGKEVVQTKIELQSGYCKTKKSGKWGIVKNNGTEIVTHKYDEIGSFRGRLIGVINGRITKLNAYYDYPIYISGKYIETDKKRIYVDIYGVKCHLPSSKISQAGLTPNQLFGNKGICDKLAFANLLCRQQSFELKILNDNQLSRPSNKGDKRESFTEGETVTGTIVSLEHRKSSGIKRIRRVKVAFADGRETKISRMHFEKWGKNINDYKIKCFITLKKYGFDDDLDQTLWEII